MRDLTVGSVPGHIVGMATPIAIGMLFQTLYYLVDLYFVATLGPAAIAGVSAAGNIQFLIMAATQILGVGAMALIAQAAGRKDRADVADIYQQCLLLSVICGLGTIGLGYAAAAGYMDTLSPDPASQSAGLAYLNWVIPGLALQFVLATLGSSLRGVGIAKPVMVAQVASLTLNAILSPILIIGWPWGEAAAMGAAGAGLATTLSLLFGTGWMMVYLRHHGDALTIAGFRWRPRLPVWRRIFKIGLPPGGEMGLMFVYLGAMYYVCAQFGATEQAGFGVGVRVMQAIFLPAMAIAFAVAPVAGQNMGAQKMDRVRGSFFHAAAMSCGVMAVLTLLCQIRPEWMIAFFADTPEVIAVGSDYLRIISFNFVASGLIFTCNGMFQALGNTMWSLVSSGSRMLTFIVPIALLLPFTDRPLSDLWVLSVISVGLQAVLSLLLLWRVFPARSHLAGEA